MGLTDIAGAADEAAVLLEAKKGLKHRKHARHIGPARADVEKVLRHYWARQEAAVLAEIKPRLAAILAQHPPPAIPVHEAASTAKVLRDLAEGQEILIITDGCN